MPTNKNEHLECVIESHKTSKEQKLFDKHRIKKDEVKSALSEKYGADIYNPFNAGSYAKNTAINTKFDFDLISPFKRDSFDTLEAMYNAVYDFLREKYQQVATVRQQKVSIGLEFHLDEDGDKVKIDVVPGRELKQDQYKDNNKINLYVFKQFGKIEQGSDRISSNVKAQIDNIRQRATDEKDSIRKVIRLLKVWKVRNGKTAKSFFLELITIKAYDSKSISGDLWDKLKSVMEFIRDNVKTVSLPDPGNSNNNVADTLTDSDKGILSEDMKTIIERIEENKEYISSYFPVNSKFPCEEENKGSYSVKKSQPSIPPPAQFGLNGKKTSNNQ